MKTRITKLFGIKHPIIQGGMHYVGYAEMDAGAWSCGMVAGLIHDIPTCKELIDSIMSEANSLILERLEGMLAK